MQASDAQDEALANFLLDAGLVSRPQLAEAGARAGEMGERLAQVLVILGVLDEDEVRRALAKVLGVPFIELLSEESILSEALTVLPEPFCRLHGVVAYQTHKARGAQPTLEVALLDLSAIEQLQALRLPYVLRVRLTSRASMTRALLFYQHLLKEAFASAAPGAPLDVLLERALYSSAQSVQVTPVPRGYLVRYGLAGGQYDAAVLPVEVGQEILDKVKRVSQLKESEAQSGQQGSFKIRSDAGEVLVRVLLLPAVSGEGVTLQLIRQDSGRLGETLESVGLHGKALAHVRQALHKRQGLILVAGAAGSPVPTQTGKEACLYALLDTFGSYAHSVHTVELEVSKRLPFATQTEVGIRGSVATAVRAALLHEPDVLFISTIADRETALLALEAANRGVFVLAGIEAQGAAAGVEKLLMFGVSPRTLARTLQLAIGTGAVRALCPACAPGGEQYALSRAEVASLEGEIDFARILAALKEEHLLEQDVLWRDVSFGLPVGCDECQGGYRGSVSVVEVLPRSLVLQEALLGQHDGVSAEVLEALARDEGMLTRTEDAVYRAAAGQTSLEEALSLEA